MPKRRVDGENKRPGRLRGKESRTVIDAQGWVLKHHMSSMVRKQGAVKPAQVPSTEKQLKAPHSPQLQPGSTFAFEEGK